MKFVILFLLIPSNIFCTNNEFESTDEVVPMDNRRRQDCAIVIEKFLEEFSKQQAKVETKHFEEMNAVKSQLAKVETKLEKVETKLEVVTNELAEVKTKHSEELAKIYKGHSVEVNAVKDELAEVKVKHSEKLAEMITLIYDVAKAKTNCSEEVKSMKIELNDTREALSKEVEEKLAEMITLRYDVAEAKTNCSEEVKSMKIELIEAREELSNEVEGKLAEMITQRHDVADSRLETVKEEVSGKLLIQYFGSCYLSNEGYLKALPDLYVGNSFELKMTVKPEKLTGILAAIRCKSNEFLHLQLIDGNLVLTAADGDDPYNATYNLPNGFWDKGWHEITARIPMKNKMELKVDNMPTATSYGTRTNKYYIYTVRKAFFIGGHENPNGLPDIMTMKNFQGWIKDIHINGDPITVEKEMYIGDVQYCVQGSF